MWFFCEVEESSKICVFIIMKKFEDFEKVKKFVRFMIEIWGEKFKEKVKNSKKKGVKKEGFDGFLVISKLVFVEKLGFLVGFENGVEFFKEELICRKCEEFI